MKKHFAVIIIAIFILLNFSNVSLAYHDYRTWDFQIGNYELTNPNPNNPKLYVLETGLSVLLSNDEHDLGYTDIQLSDDFNYLGIDFNDYEVLSYKVYNPSDFDFENENVIRAVTPYSKTQDDFDRFYYRPGNLQWGESFFIAEGCLRGGFQFRYNKDLAICDLNKYFKLPGAEETLIDLYQLGDLADRFIEFAKGNTRFDDSYSYSDSHLFSFAIVVELEKKSNELPVPKGDFLKAVNEAEFTYYSYRYGLDDSGITDEVTVWGNIVDAFNNYYKKPKWKESYDGVNGVGIVEFWGVQPTETDVRTDDKWKDKNVYVKFYIPYTKEKGYEYIEADDSEKKLKYVWTYDCKFGEEERNTEHDVWLYVEPIRSYFKYVDGRIEELN